MMTKKKTPVIRRMKFVWALPAFALLLFAFAEPEYRTSEQTKSNDETLTKDVLAQKTILVKGTIYDETGDPLPGTSIVVKGGTIGTVSDFDGTYSIEIPEKASLVLSFVGKKTIVYANSEITSAAKIDGAFVNSFRMEDAVQVLHNAHYSGEQPPPPPPLTVEETELKEKLTPPPPAKESKAKETIAPPPPPKNGEKEVFYIVEDMPQFPGGYYAMQDYISKMQQKISQAKGVKGKAKVSFTVNGKGKVIDVKVVEKDNDSAAKGAVMIASAMPEWTPGKQRGKSVPVKYILPVEFK